MMRSVRRGILAVVAALTFVPVANAAAPLATAQSTAPLTVTFRADGPATSYGWDFGDGTAGEGAVVEHRYVQPGRYTATLTTELGQATVEAVAYRLVFQAPARAGYDRRSRFTGSIWPAPGAVPVEILRPDGGVAYRGRVRPDGGFVLRGRIRTRGPFRARIAGLLSEPDAILLRPVLDARVVGSGLVGQPLRVVAHVRPAAAGTVEVAVWRNGRRVPSSLRLPTSRPASYRIRVVLRPADGYTGAARTLTAAVLRPSLSLGARGAGVRALEQRLTELRYAVHHIDGLYGYDTYQAVLAFQKVNGLPRTGRVDARVWRAIANGHVPRAHYRGTHIEVIKGRQVLLVVRNSLVVTVVHVSTGATGNTPLGRWRIYRKYTGWSGVLWYPMFFVGGFAIHGYPSVPAYPASHGCVRVPMWIAPRLFAMHDYGQTVYIYV